MLLSVECSDMDGIFGVDMAAIACLREAKLRKLKVPEELSIVSIDGTYITKLGPEILTSIVQPIEKMAKKLVSMIILQIEGKQVEEKLHKHQFELIKLYVNFQQNYYL
jgi:LacI family sucrose operon transcriptional repressor